MKLEETKKIPLTVVIIVSDLDIIYAIWDKNKCLKIAEQKVYDKESKNKFLEVIEKEIRFITYNKDITKTIILKDILKDLEELKKAFKADFYISNITLEFSNCDLCSNITFANTTVFLVVLLNELSFAKYYLPHKRPEIKTIEKNWEKDYLNIYDLLNKNQIDTLHIEKYLETKDSNLEFKETRDTIRAFNLGAYLTDLKNKKEEKKRS